MTESLEKVLSYLGENPKVVHVMGATGHVKLRAPRLQTRAVVYLAERLGVAESDILAVSDISGRTFHLRQSRQEPLTVAESDRLLRIARVAAEAERVFGNPAKSRRWLTTEHRLLGATPLDLLGFDIGAREVEEELGRIDFGDFA